jgi:DNA-binding PadR family transcriptional regulator
VPKKRPRVLTVSPKELLVLESLVRNRELYGLQLVSGSRGRLKRGTIYVTLGRMEEKGYITSRLDDPPPGAGGMPRRIYAPTALGRRMLSIFSSGATELLPQVAR